MATSHETIPLTRTCASTLDISSPSLSALEFKEEGGPGDRELGIIHFLAQQLSPDLRQAPQKPRDENMEEFALDELGEEDKMHGGIKRGWTEEDEALLIKLVNHHGSHKGKWKMIANSMTGIRTPGQVREKWLRMQREGRAGPSSPSLTPQSTHSMIGALQAAARQQDYPDPPEQNTDNLMGRVVAGVPGVMTPQCHRCHHRKPGRGYASCENGLAHHFCERCIHNSFGFDLEHLLADPHLWSCPVCNWTCPCAACERRSSQHNLPHGNAPAQSNDGAPCKIKKGWSDADASLLVSLVHRHQDHKNKWKLVAAAMPDARTPGQVKEKYHRMQKLPEFEHLAAKLLQSSPTTHDDSNPNSTPVMDSQNTENKTTSTSDTALKLMTSQKSASGFRGVSRAGSRWEAYIGNGTAGKRYIGRFDTPKEAAIAYAKAYSAQPKGAHESPRMSSRTQDTCNSPVVRGGAEQVRVCGPCKRRRSTVNYCQTQQMHDAPNWDKPVAAPPPVEPTATAGTELVRSSKAASGYMGVAKAGCRWEAYISAGQRGKRFKRYIGCYDTPELAAQAYLQATTKSERQEEERDAESDDDGESKDWFSDECEDARNQVIHALSSLPSLASVAHENPPDLKLPPSTLEKEQGECEASSSADLLMQVSSIALMGQ